MFDAISDSSVRYDGLLVLSIKNGNPNGNPDMDNIPRTTLDGNGLISDVSIKRRIRDHILLNHDGEQGNGIFVRPGANMQVQIAEAAGVKADAKKVTDDKSVKAVGSLLRDFWDIRMFGSVLSIGALADRGTFAKVQGPANVCFGESISPVTLSEHAITRVVHADKDKEDAGTMGRKQVIDEGIYLVRVGYSPNLLKSINNKFADGSEFRIDKARADADLALFWEGLYHLYEMRSASIGDANVLGLAVFQHSSALGNAQAHRLLERVAVEGGKVLVDSADMPTGVNLAVFD